MSTKAEQFASKIRYLQEYHNRVLHNIYPVPSGTDIANTLKYFSQTLLSILSCTGKKENQDASNLTVPMTMCLFPVPFPLTPSLRPQVSSINPTVTRSLLYSVLRDAPSERGQQSRDAQLSDYPSLDYQGLYVTLVTLLDLVPLLQHGQHAWNPIHCQHIECHNAINKPAVKMCIDPSLSVALGDKPPPLYLCEECSQRIAGLLKEAEFHAEQREYELNRRRQMGLSSSHHSLDNTDFDNKDDDKHDQRLLSQFGIWFLVSLCTPSENTPTESLARLVSMVFQWFHSTAYMMDDEVGSLVEKLKPQFVTKWLKTVCDVRFDVMVMCLLPKPMEFARVGGYWDKSCSAVTQLKEGLNRILCLIPYNVINQPVWECIMPEWLEAIRTEVPDNQLKEFREVLSKMFDIELCPLPFSMEEMFGFISCRFTGYPSSVQEQALLWLHVLSELDIVVPLQLLISMFSDGVNSVKELANQRKSRVSELAGNLAARRVSVASDPGRRVQHMLSPFPSPFQSPFRSPIRSPFHSPFKNFGHPSGKTIDFDCEDDEMNLNCFILMFDLILKQMELQDDGVTLGLENSISKDIISIINNVFQAPWGGSHTCQKDEKAVECGLCQSSILCYQLGFELLEQLAPKEEIRLVEPTDNLEDSLLYTRPEFIIGTEGEEEDKVAPKHGENPGNHTETTENAAIKNDTERKFCYQQLPVTLKLIYTILQGLCLCLDFQFDTVVKDRPTILSKLLLLHFLKADIPALSWEFFVNRFETLSLEAQLHLDCNKEFPFPTTVSLTRHEQSAPALGGTPEQTPGQPSPENDNTIKDLLPEDAGIDHQTVHQLITVLMKFMAKDESSAESDISSAKAFNTVKRHLYVLLGYDQQEGCFMIAPQKMRVSTCFNAFIAGIAQVMDYNINLGKHLLPLVVQVLKYCTCPQLRHYFQQPPRCSLWSLKPHIRQMWLKALLVILYKYPYRDCEISKIVLHLIHITVNTLNAQYHSCKPHATAGPLYSDNSNISRYSEKEKAEEDSVFDESDIHDTPTGPCNKESQTFFARLKRIGGSKMVKYQPVEMNAQRSMNCFVDEHRRKSCIDRCDLEKPPVPAAYAIHRQSDYGRSRQNSSTKAENIETQENLPPAESFQEIRRPVIPEVRLNCMETYEVKVDSPVKPSGPKEDLDLIDLSSDSTSGPEKHSVLSTSDSDSLVFEPLPPLRIVESDEEETTNQLNDEVSGKTAVSSPSTPINVSALSLSTTPLVQFSIEDCSKDFSSKDTSNTPSAGIEDILSTSPKDQKDSSELVKPEEVQDMSCGNPLTLKQKRDLLQKSFALPEMSLDDNSELSVEEIRPSGAIPSPNVKTVFIKVPEDSENQTESDKLDTNTESDTEQNTEQKQEEETEESEFKIQIVPRQRKQRKIAVSAIQREYLDISFNILDKLGEQKEADPAAKGLSTLEMPRESSSAPTLEAGVPETSSHSSISTQFRQMKRGSLGALTMNQLMKRQLEHQSSAPHNISTWDTEQIQHGKRLCNVPVCLNPDLEGPPLRIRGATKSSLLSAPSIVSMFVPAPEEFADDQPTVMTDKCHDCGAILEEYDEETLGLAIVVLSTFIHLSPDLAAPLLLDIMQSVGRLASSTSFSNQAESMMIPGNAAGVAKQFLRCVFHQLAPNGIFPQLFQSNIKDGSFLRTLATSLMDFSELSSIAALSQLLESLLEPFSKLLSFVIQNAVFTLAYLVELCGLCYRAFTKERDKFYLTRSVILELLQALKLKSPLPDMNLLLLVQFVCADAGTKLAESTILHKQMIASMPGCGTAAMECMRQYVGEVLDFIADMHTLTKLKSHMKTCSQPLHEDTFGGHLKVGLAQIAAMEITRGNHRDNKAVIRYLPWLYHPPSAMQQGPKEFIECVSHIRLLSWLLLGSLTHNVVCPNSPSSCMPIPLDAGSQIADHLIVILIGFPEQSKTSVLHMCSLFHAFIFAQLWTVYCEQTAVAPTVQNQNEFSFTAILTALEFWSRVTPSILQLMAHNKVMVEMVCLHVISLMEALQECNSTIFVKICKVSVVIWGKTYCMFEVLQRGRSVKLTQEPLIPMWLPMIQSNLKHLSAGLQLRLQAIQSNVNHHSLRMLQGSGQMNNSSSVLRKWLQCTQFKMAQVEIQSSEAASQFYPL
ncbi:protein unc-79 [Grus japonensis]|uniref:Protein unc-79 n=1 Tax=Grus japonensis TaxID=30415 RepID=A0ABC9WZM8_GRUJA